jgi:hypothetical protein
MKKLLNYFRLIKLMNNATMSIAWYKIVQSVMDYAIQVQQHGKPMLTKIAVVDMSEEKIIGDFDMVSIWAGVGDANPIERGKHLKAQNTELKRLLQMCHGKIEVPGNEDLLLNVKLVLDTFE